MAVTNTEQKIQMILACWYNVYVILAFGDREILHWTIEGIVTNRIKPIVRA